MKTKFARILGVGVTLALLASLLISAIPAAAISQPQVSLVGTVDPVADAYVISKANNYTVIFTITKDVLEGEQIVVTFPADTGLTGITSVTLGASSGIGSDSFADVPATTLAVDGTKLTITVPDVNTDDMIGMGAMVAVKIYSVTNPPAAGAYTLTVATQKSATVPIEAAATSATYTIVIPTIPPLPGIASLYNSTGVLMAQYVGNNAIQECIDDITGPNYTVQVGPGTYTYDTTANVSHLMIKGTGATSDLVVLKKYSTVSLAVTVDNVTLDNMTFDGGVVVTDGDFNVKNCAFKNGTTQLTIGATPATVDTCTFAVTGSVDIGIAATAKATIKNSAFSVDTGGTAIAGTTDVSISDCTFTGASGTGLYVSAGTSTVKTSTFKTLTPAINVIGGAVTVSGSTIEGCGASTGSGDAITISSGTLTLYGNTIKDSAAANWALNASGGTVTAWFNNITGNTKNINGGVSAEHNWWGNAAGPAAGSNGIGVTATSPAGASISAASAAMNAKTLDASTTVGLYVDAGATSNIAVAKYSGNPQLTPPPIVGTGSVLGYYDVYIPNASANTVIKFYGAVTGYTKVYNGGALSGAWTEPVTSGVNVAGGYAYVTITSLTSPGTSDLTGLVFAVVDDKTTPPPSLGTPEVGKYGVPIAPTYTWSKVPGAIRYEIALAEDPTFSIVEWSYNVTNNFYKDTEELKYKTTYYWRVRGVLAEPYLDGKAWVTPSTPWAVGIFTTEAEPPPPEEPQEIVVPPADVTVEIPPTKITVEQPGPFIPEYLLWVIVGIGAVLLIALIVLIVRTRRVV